MATTSGSSAATASGATASPSECLVIQYGDFLPWNNTYNIVTAETVDLIRRLKDVAFLPILFLIGAPANVINMAVFYKQGLKERINVCLFALSLADCLYLLGNELCVVEQLYLQFTTKEIYGPIYEWMANHFYLGLYGLTWVSQVLSAIIASERCFCILYPLRSHTVLRTSTTTVIIIVVFIIVIGVQLVASTRYYITCAYDPMTDLVIKTMASREFYYRHKDLVDFVDVIIYGVGLPGVVIVIVTSTTIVTAVKLRQVVAWRAGTSSRGGDVSGGGGGGSGGGGGISVKEIALTKMLVYNSVFFIICVFPIGLYRITLLFLPEVNGGKRYHNFYMSVLWILTVLTCVNATFNFLIYYTMGSRYRQTLKSMFCFQWSPSEKTHKSKTSKTLV